MDQMTSEWPWTLNGQNFPVCTKYLPQKAQIFPVYSKDTPKGLTFAVSLYDQSFSRYRLSKIGREYMPLKI